MKVELIVNGEAVQQQEIAADGELSKLKWNVDIKHSSWLAVRILPSVHTNPIWVVVDDQPVRANRKSAKWCREAVDVCWNSKKNQIRESERKSAREAYDEAAAIYDRIIEESVVK